MAEQDMVTIERYDFMNREFTSVEKFEFTSHEHVREAWRTYARQDDGFYRARYQGSTLFGLDHPEDSGAF